MTEIAFVFRLYYIGKNHCHDTFFSIGYIKNIPVTCTFIFSLYNAKILNLDNIMLSNFSLAYSVYAAKNSRATIFSIEIFLFDLIYLSCKRQLLEVTIITNNKSHSVAIDIHYASCIKRKSLVLLQRREKIMDRAILCSIVRAIL